MQNIDTMLKQLENNTAVKGLIRYGADHRADGYSLGDYDLFVVFSDDSPPVESLHFDVERAPVDLNFITLDALNNLAPTLTFPYLALSEGTVIFDRDGKVGPALECLKKSFVQQPPKKVSEHSVAFMRHGHRHVMDKLRGRLESEPLLARFLLGVNPYWLMENYFRVRQLPFRGEGHALRYWREYEPEIYQTLESLYETRDLQEKYQINERLAELILAPVGGAWQPGEVLAFGTHESENLAELGQRVYQALFRSSSSHD